MVLFPIVYCRTSSRLPWIDNRLKELHPKELKELKELPNIFAGIVIPFIYLYCRHSVCIWSKLAQLHPCRKVSEMKFRATFTLLHFPLIQMTFPAVSSILGVR